MYRRILSLTLAIILALALAVTAAGAGCPCNIEYRLGAKGVSANKTTDSIPSDTKPSAANIPSVQGLGSWAFVGWSTTGGLYTADPAAE